MKAITYILLSLLLCACVGVGNVKSARLLLSDPGQTATIQTLTTSHKLLVNEHRTLIYNGEEIFRIPEGQRVVFEVFDGQDPAFKLEDN